MPCDETVIPRDIYTSMDELNKALEAGTVTVTIDQATGAAALDNWNTESRRGMTDVCAIQRLMTENSWAWQQAVATAETMAGRQVNLQAVGSGMHRHGATWHSGH